MDENKKYKIAQEAKVIVSGYAFVKKNDNITIVNLNKNDVHASRICNYYILKNSSIPLQV